MKPIDVEDLRLNYDPERPQARFKDAGVKTALLESASQRLPDPPKWPSASAASGAPLARPPSETAALDPYDAVIVTWTSAEAAALAAILTPGHPVSTWYEYRRGIDAYVPKVTGPRAPFNDKSAEMVRYYHSLGLYFPCRIGAARVLLFKSGLHFVYDGPATPVMSLMSEIVTATRPKVLVTTGTGGGIGADIKLGDVVIAGAARFDCRTQFKGESWRAASYRTTPVPSAALSALKPDLLRPNAAKIVPQGARETPKFWSAATDEIVTTDFFGFDDSTDHYRLEGPGHRACDMGDAMVGRALQGHAGVHWFAIRNASDPQIPNPKDDIKAAEQEAGRIYSECGAFTTAASVIASWAVVDAVCNGK
ncbi:MAG TPA: hypothetical protein VKU41_10135 [Polyangiaceae bacterium]|nr:hypothetical protein [Polyangiaceae bacterium]